MESMDKMMFLDPESSKLKVQTRSYKLKHLICKKVFQPPLKTYPAHGDDTVWHTYCILYGGCVRVHIHSCLCCQSNFVNLIVH